MKRTQRAAGFSLIELLAVLLIAAVLAAIALPAIGKARQSSGVEQSLANLVTLGVAHVLYAADWNGRQVTWAVDDLAAFGDDVGDYCDNHGGCYSFGDPGCHPPLLVGWGSGAGGSGLWGFWPCLFAGHNWAVNPIGFPGGQGLDGFGNFRFPNFKAFHDYVNGRFYDPTFYAPNDTVPYELALPLFGDPNEFNTEGNPPIWCSYVLSPAAMYDPDVMRSNAAGGWQNPWDLDYGFQSPGLFQAQYPDLKTQMIEHHWLQGPPADCNPNWPGSGSFEGCEPYYFNHGIDSTPATLFYDGHVRLLPNTEVYAADQQILKQTGGVDGLWHRGTPFNTGYGPRDPGGYFIEYGYDGVPLSHHILTTDGILGRDTLGGMPSIALSPSTFQFRRSPQRPSDISPVVQSNLSTFTLTTSDGDQP